MGQKVSQGEVLVILEAMKMETEISAACDGVVARIDIREGDSIEVGQAVIALTV